MAMSVSVLSSICRHLLSVYYVLSHACSVGVISPPRGKNSFLEGEKIFSYCDVLWPSKAQPYSTTSSSSVFNFSHQEEFKLN